jgi:hypothetical protein
MFSPGIKPSQRAKRTTLQHNYGVYSAAPYCRTYLQYRTAHAFGLHSIALMQSLWPSLSPHAVPTDQTRVERSIVKKFLSARRRDAELADSYWHGNHAKDALYTVLYGSATGTTPRRSSFFFHIFCWGITGLAHSQSFSKRGLEPDQTREAFWGASHNGFYYTEKYCETKFPLPNTVDPFFSAQDRPGIFVRGDRSWGRWRALKWGIWRPMNPWTPWSKTSWRVDHVRLRIPSDVPTWRANRTYCR